MKKQIGRFRILFWQVRWLFIGLLRSQYLWLGILPLSLVLLAIALLRKELENPHELIKHLAPEAIGLLAGIPLVYLVVEAALRKREDDQWKFSRQETIRQMLLLSNSLVRYIFAACAEYLQRSEANVGYDIELAGGLQELRRTSREFVARHSAITTCFAVYSSRLEPRLHKALWDIEEKLLGFINIDFEISYERSFYLLNCSILQQTVNLIENALRSVYSEDILKSGNAMKVLARDSSPFVDVSAILSLQNFDLPKIQIEVKNTDLT